MTDAIFKANVLKHKTYYETLRSQLGLVDFNPLTVDWTTPVPWGNDPDKCNMDDDSGAPALFTSPLLPHALPPPYTRPTADSAPPAAASGCLMPLAAGLCALHPVSTQPSPAL